MNELMQRVDASLVVGISDLKRNPTAVLARTEGAPVAILNHNRVVAYLVPAEAYEAIMDRLEDAELNAIADAREGQPIVMVSPDEL